MSALQITDAGFVQLGSMAFTEAEAGEPGERAPEAGPFLSALHIQSDASVRSHCSAEVFLLRLGVYSSPCRCGGQYMLEAALLQEETEARFHALRQLISYQRLRAA